MNWDPIQYLMSVDQARRAEDHRREIEIYQIKAALGKHEDVIESLAQWRTSVQRKIRRWPYLVVPLAIIALNAIGPEKAVDVAIKILKFVL